MLTPEGRKAAADAVVDEGAFVRCTYTGEVPRGFTDVVSDKLLAIEAAHRARGEVGPLRVLYDIRTLARLEPGVAETVIRRRSEFQQRRMAVLGPPGRIASIVTLLTEVTGGTTTRYFTMADDATAWLTRA